MEEEESEGQVALRISRRGALEAFKALAKDFGEGLFDKVPKFWDGIALALTTTFPDGMLPLKKSYARCPPADSDRYARRDCR